MSRKKRHSHEEHIDETWLIPYSDLLTLLLALFIVLFASSQIDAKKLGDMRQVFNAIFSGNIGAMDQSSTIAGNSPNTTNIPNSGAQDLSKIADARNESLQLMQLQKELDKYIQQNNLGEKLTTTLTGDGLMITIGEVALFPSGSAELLPEARKIVGEISKMIVAHPQKITIAGHTDNIPINTREFPSNWDLSTKRSLNFMKLLLQNDKLNPAQFNATGYGEFRPVATNDTADGRQKNRRVEVFIQRIYKE